MRDWLSGLWRTMHGERRHAPRANAEHIVVTRRQRAIAYRLAPLTGGTPDDELREAAALAQRRLSR